MNNKHSIINIFVDYAKAFDSVNHVILLRKLYRYGIRGIALQIIESFLKNRRQVVQFKNHISDPKTLNIGVPQSSILGPLLYLIFVDEKKLSAPHLR